MSTPYHSKYWAHALTLKSPSDSIDNLSRSIANARVDLNPHQVDAALFALRSPLSRGAILADEVGLGKTIEAALVIAQRWAERKRRVLLIVPATLRRQWQQELSEKFFLPSLILDSRAYNQAIKEGRNQPFCQADRIVACSYQFAAMKAQEIRRVPWDLVVIDEAHRLRNIFKPRSKQAKLISSAVAGAPKLLLTATPLQNSLLELYGLVSVIDDHVFGDIESFREQFLRANDEELRNALLRERLRAFCIRTLRKQVVEYIPFTRRIPITQDFIPSDDEQRLYDLVSAYLQRPTLIALPASQRNLITLVLRKLLASSTFAIGGTLWKLVSKLERLDEALSLLDDEDLEGIGELQEEWTEDDEEIPPATGIDFQALREELQELRGYAQIADSIRTNAKGEALIPALKIAFDRAAGLGAARKAVIFTESRRTQQYLFDLLSARGYAGQLVLINGSNNDPHSKVIYDAWKARHQGQELVTGSRPIDMKAAIAEHFREHASILIATEAAAEGVNLQFCSIVVNFDLPWNPQRVEQRIGRCHRYGQKHDVVVLNFLNRRNAADLRVFQLLSEKFQLFDGVFGASDEILGVIESGVDLERRIAKVYQECRDLEEIANAFDALQQELEDQIRSRLDATRRSLLEHFDTDVSERLRVHKDKTLESLNQRERWLLELTRTELDGHARFEPDRPRFYYDGSLSHPGHYHFDWKEAEKCGDSFYRENHPLAEAIIERARARNLPPAELRFSYSAYGGVISVLKPLIGRSGSLEVSRLTIESLDTEEYLIFAGQTDTGEPLDPEVCRKLLLISATVHTATIPLEDLTPLRDAGIKATLKQVEERNARFFDEEVLKLDLWSEDLKQGLEREIKELDKAIREARKLSTLAGSLNDKLEAQKQVRALEATRNKKRRELFDAQDQIDAQRDRLIAGLEQQLQQRVTSKPLFTVRWTIED
ncbi:MAG: SNF2-related protein [Candidatus Hydrogenedentales bacterium]